MTATAQPPQTQTPLEAFQAHLEERLALDPSGLAQVKIFNVQDAAKSQDIRFLTLPLESYDGIWAHRSLAELPNVGCQRLFALFFSALKPRGSLFVSTEKYSEDDFSSLIRQHGFQILSVGRNPERAEERGFLCQRL